MLTSFTFNIPQSLAEKIEKYTDYESNPSAEEWISFKMILADELLKQICKLESHFANDVPF